MEKNKVEFQTESNFWFAKKTKKVASTEQDELGENERRSIKSHRSDTEQTDGRENKW